MLRLLKSTHFRMVWCVAGAGLYWRLKGLHPHRLSGTLRSALQVCQHRHSEIYSGTVFRIVLKDEWATPEHVIRSFFELVVQLTLPDVFCLAGDLRVW